MATFGFDTDLVLQPIPVLPPDAKPFTRLVEEMIDTLLAWNLLTIGHSLWGEEVRYLFGNRSGCWTTLDIVGIGKSGALYAFEVKRGPPRHREIDKFERDVLTLASKENLREYLGERYTHNRDWIEWYERRKFAAFHLGTREQTERETLDLTRKAVKKLGITPAELERLVKKGAKDLLERSASLDEFLRRWTGLDFDAIANHRHRAILLSPYVNRAYLAEAAQRIEGAEGRLKFTVEYVSFELMSNRQSSYLRIGSPERASRETAHTTEEQAAHSPNPGP